MRSARNEATPAADRDESIRLVAASAAVPAPKALRLRARALWIAGAYAVVSILWIWFSDRVLAGIVVDETMFLLWSSWKGFGFVAATTMLLFIMLRRAFVAMEDGFDDLKDAQRRLRRSESQLAAVIGSAMDAIIAVDGAGHVALFNDAAARMFRRVERDALGLPLDRLVPGLGPDVHGERLVREGVRATGERFPVEASVSSVNADEHGLLILVLRDISERLAKQSEIARLGRLYAALGRIDQAIVRISDRTALFERVCSVLVEDGGLQMAWVGMVDPETRVVHAAASAGDAADYLATIRITIDDGPEGRGPTGTALRENRPIVCNDVLADPAMAPWWDAARTNGFLASAVFPIHCHDVVIGSLSVYADSSDFFRDEEIALLGSAAADLSMALDSLATEAERRAAEAQALNERRFSDTMIESMPGILYLYTEEGRFLRWNRNFELVSGYRAAAMAGMHPSDFFGPVDVVAMQESVAEVFANGEGFLEADFVNRDGVGVPYFFTGRRVELEGQPCLIGMGIDIADRKRAETALRELNETLEQKVDERTEQLETALERAEHADRLKSAFLATMSHELRTPLNSIIGFTGIVLQELAGPLNAEQSKQLGMVRGSARHLLDLINDVLDLSKIEAGQLEVRAAPFMLPESVAQVADTIRPLAVAKELTLDVRLDPHLGEMVSDRRRVEQVLLNLLGNAVKFTERGGVTLVVERLESRAGAVATAAGPAVRMAVMDTGIGIRSEDLDTLFRPFRQIHAGLDRPHDGTGLGLAICRRLARLMGGEILVESAWEQGSTFAVELPLDRARHA